MASAYIIFLNPLILSGNSIGFPTGMPAEAVTLATTVSTGCATLIMGLVANYPWVVSVQLGTNVYFVNNVLQPFYPCGAHATLTGNDTTCARITCECTGNMSDPSAFTVTDASAPASCASSTNVCLGTRIPFEQALTATFLEGVVFLLICITGLRYWFLKVIPKQILLAGACGIGIFISFVGFRDSGFITQAPYPTLTRLNLENQYNGGVVIDMSYHDGPRWNSCVMYFGGAPFGVQCNWLSLGGLIFTGLLLCWELNGALIAGILFTTFISWIKFPNKYTDPVNPGLVPPSFAAVPSFAATAGQLDFNWGSDTGKLIGALFTFLYLDFLGSAITFAAMGTMCGMLNESGDIPKSNLAFISDAVGTMIGGLTGTSALTTYVESASAVREGGRTGLTACVCAVLFFLSCFFWPWTGHIPTIATGPILILIGVIIFMSGVYEVDWKRMDNAIPNYMTMIVMPLTNNIAYGIIAGWLGWLIAKFFCFQMTKFPLYQVCFCFLCWFVLVECDLRFLTIAPVIIVFVPTYLLLLISQEKWQPMHGYFNTRIERSRSMFVRIPGWNDHDDRSTKFDADQLAKKSSKDLSVHDPSIGKNSVSKDVESAQDSDEAPVVIPL